MIQVKNKYPLYEMRRSQLYERIPLDAPMSVTIEPSSYCNFHCKYCAQALGDRFDQRHFKREIMKWELFELLVEQLKEFGKLKKIHLFRNGEPLCNPHIADMVDMLKKEEVCETINISTNADLLNHELSQKLIDAGLDSLSVSLQGLNEERYFELCGKRVDFDDLYENLSFFYRSRKSCNLYIKVIDLALGQNEEEHFYKMFSPIADRVYVESAVPVYESIDYSGMLKKMHVTRSGRSVQEPKICQLAFYHLHILANGDVVPCNSIEFPMKIFNIRETSLKEIWNGKERRDFLRKQLEGKRKENIICKNCQRLCQEYQPEDGLDGHAAEILERWKQKYGKEW